MQRELRDATRLPFFRNATAAFNLAKPPPVPPGWLRDDTSIGLSWRGVLGSKAYLLSTSPSTTSGILDATNVTQFPSSLGGTLYGPGYQALHAYPSGTFVHIRYGAITQNFDLTGGSQLAIWVEGSQGTSRTLTIKLQTQAGVDLTATKVYNQQSVAGIGLWSLWNTTGAVRINVVGTGDNPFLRAILLD